MLDKKYNFKDNDKKWQEFWKENKIYAYNKKPERETYSIDTPPPTVSGHLHIGHFSSFAQADMMARFHRMSGKNLYFPLGFDNNGLPTEILVEKERKLRAHTLPREEFRKIAMEVVDKYNKEYASNMYTIGLSADFSLGYDTINELSQKTSQKSFIELAKKGIAYRSDKPSPWCCKCRTSVATAELEDSEIASTFNYLNFRLADGSGTIPIATTRPEFLPACGAIFVNPEDDRYKKFVGKMVKVPLFEDIEVKVLTDSKVGIDKGTGIVMCCTFGDQTDVEWWKEYNLPLKQAIDDGGKMTELAGKYAGMKILDARKAIIEDLIAGGYMDHQEPIVHNVKVHERCNEPIEFMAKKQWFIKSCSPELKKIWIEQGNKINWHPESMQVRYNAWVENLNQDWSISRQRYFGVPIPVWYCKECGEPIFAEISDLPVNPLTSQPKHACKCGSIEFIPESDILDTWATSSLTPQINTNWFDDEKGSNAKMPMNMRFCGRDIITTWDLRTIIKAYFHQNTIPWKDLYINGWVMADKGVKISKHLNNNKMDFASIMDSYGADIFRYWCANGAYGRDVYFSDDGLKDGYKLLNKLWNASKFVLSFMDDYDNIKPAKIWPQDEYIMHKFNEAYVRTVNQYENVEMGYAKVEIEKFFWDFCDNYIEIAKNRLYKPDVYGVEAKKSAQWACYNVLFGMLKLFAITMPHVTEEIYQDFFKKFEKEESIHLLLLSPIEIKENKLLVEAGNEFIEILSEVRKYKSSNNLSMKEEISEVTLSGYSRLTGENELDLKAVCSIKEIKYLSSKEKQIAIK